jgi:hypothetical protein
MQTCPKCGEKFQDQFESCWKCAGTSSPAAPTPKKKKPLEMLEFICIMVAAMPGILLFNGGRVQNRPQAVFRISIFVIGVLGFIVVKIYQRKRMRGER